MSPRWCAAGSHERGRTWARLAVVYLLVLAGCATGVSGGVGGHPLPGPSPSAKGATLEAPSTPDEDDDPEDDSDEEARALGEVATPPETEGEEALEEWGEGGVGWRDGVGDGRPRTVPMSLDYFQGFLAHVGVPAEALPVDGRTLSPEQAVGLLPHLLSTEVKHPATGGRAAAGAQRARGSPRTWC